MAAAPGPTTTRARVAASASPPTRAIQYVRARAPLRLSFAGGGTDVPPYCDEHGGVVLSATINRYAHAVLSPIQADALRFRSLDLDRTAEYGLDHELYPDGRLDLLTAVARYFYKDRTHGFELSVRTDAPPGSGVGASSAVVVATITAFKEWLHLPLSPYDLAALAYQIERIDLGIQGGKQDQYAASFGGFNLIEFQRDATVVQPLKVDDNIVHELEERLVLCHTGRSALGVGIIEDQVKRYKEGREDSREAMEELKRVCHEMKRALLLGDIDTMGTLLNDSYHTKRRLSPKIATPTTDKIYQAALKAGALGGKISGAGGGGFMFFVAAHDKLLEVRRALKDLGADPIDVTFEPKGAHGWRADENRRVTWNA